MRNFRSNLPQIMSPYEEVAGDQISRKEINKENKSGGGGVVILRWSKLVMETCDFFHGGCGSLGEGRHLSLKKN